MKFLIALSLLASASAFANEEFIKCWETAQEEGGRPEYVFKVKYGGSSDLDLERRIVLIKPFYTELETKHGCLKSQQLIGGGLEPQWIKFCKGEGQRHNGLIPVEVEKERYDETVYCEEDLKRFFFHHDGGGDMGAMGGAL